MMKTTWTSFVLGGALLASLQWNLRGPAPAPAAESTAGECSIDPVALGLTEEQSVQLEALCRTSCTEADALEARAEERLLELRRELSAGALDEAELRALVVEVSALRERALAACVDSVLRVREILDETQLETVLGSCCGPSGCER